ncbi:MAG: hypothetical protein ACW99A_05280 [Candidatus Kariarchaeaceae archaeon]
MSPTNRPGATPDFATLSLNAEIISLELGISELVIYDSSSIYYVSMILSLF